MADDQITGADVVVVGTGVVGCLIAEQLLDAGHSVLMLEAGPRVQRSDIVDRYRNTPPSQRTNFDAAYPAVKWAPSLDLTTPETAKEYLQLEGPDGHAYAQSYVRYAGGSTWHWAGICWRLTPEDMQMKTLHGVGRDWAFDYATLEPYYARAEHAIGVCGPSDPALQWPPIRSKPYPMDRLPFGPGEQRFTDAAARLGLINLPSAQARNSGTAYNDRPPCCGNNSCVPICPIGAKYDAASSLPRIEAKGGVVQTNSVVYRVETGARNVVQAVHYLDPEKLSHRVTGNIFVIACNGIESPKILLMSADDRNPRGVANSSDQVGRNMMDQPKLTMTAELAQPAWAGVGPVQGSSIMQTSQGAFRSEHAGALFRFENKSRVRYEAAAVLQSGLVGKALDTELRRRIACTVEITAEHELLPFPTNRTTLSAKKDWLGLPKPNIYYDVSDYIRRSSAVLTIPTLHNLARELGATKVDITPNYAASQHIMGSMIMGSDGAQSVVDADCRSHDHDNLFLPGGGAMPSAGVGNSTITMAALALKAADAIQAQLT